MQQNAANWLPNSGVRGFCQFTQSIHCVEVQTTLRASGSCSQTVLHHQQFRATVAYTYVGPMSKRPTDHLEPAAKKRGNDRQLTKDDPSDEDEVTHGTLNCALDVTKLLKLFSVPGARTAW